MGGRAGPRVPATQPAHGLPLKGQREGTCHPHRVYCFPLSRDCTPFLSRSAIHSLAAAARPALAVLRTSLARPEVGEGGKTNDVLDHTVWQDAELQKKNLKEAQDYNSHI